MSVSVLEALQNSEINFNNLKKMGINHPLFDLALNQLHNGIELLDKGYTIHEQVEPLLEKYVDIENVPEKNV